MDKNLFERVKKRIEWYRDEMIEMQKKMVPLKAISPVSGGKGEYAKAKYLEPIIKKIFDEVKECHAPYEGAEGGIRPNYIAIIKGKDTTKTLWLMAHMDVVPEGDIKLWDTDPFVATVKDGKIYGRGTEDNHQAVVSCIFTAKAFKDEDITPPTNLGLLLVSDEENGSEYGVKYILKTNKDIFDKADMVIVPDSGDKKGETIEVAEKSIVWLRVTTKGQQAHGAYPNKGVNAHWTAANFIIRMHEFYKKYDKRDDIFEPEYSTFEATKKESNVLNVNTIPGEDTVYFDCRLLPEIDCEKFIGEVRNLAEEVGREFKASISIEAPQLQKAAPPTSVNCALTKSIIKAIREINGVSPKIIGIGGNTVAQQFRNLGLPVVVCSKLDDVLHGPNEYCVIDNMLSDAKVWAHAILQQCA